VWVNDEDYGTLSEDTAAIYADAHVERIAFESD
jgi:hypothetical protein